MVQYFIGEEVGAGKLYIIFAGRFMLVGNGENIGYLFKKMRLAQEKRTEIEDLSIKIINNTIET